MSVQNQPIEEKDLFIKIEEFFEHNGKMVSIAGTSILAVIVAIVAFTNFYLPGQEKEAQEAMFQAQLYFESDSFSLALNGDGQALGFEDVISNHGMTKAADLSHHYAGICNLRLGKYQLAIDQLKKFSGDDNIISATAQGAMGDAYTELGDMAEGIAHYKKAAQISDNKLTAPYYLFKAGLALKVEGDKGAALEIFKKIKSKYPESFEAGNVDKYIAMVD